MGTHYRNYKLSYYYKVVEGLVPVIPPQNYLSARKRGRNIPAKSYTDFNTSTTLSNLPSPRNPDRAGIPTELHGVPQLFFDPEVENAQEVPNDSKQMYSCAQTKIKSREPSWMV